ncbi:MAG: hypothetical protein R8L07_15775 [Alphaproteobacteria bacterium]|nr:hypothetical protein [Alphaproteobacteria bacterium]
MATLLTSRGRPDLFDDDGQRLSLGDRIGDSGEATVFRDANDERRLVKLHHAPNDRLRAKLSVLPGLAPDDPSLDSRHVNFAWPVSTVWNAAGEAAGTIMPAVANARSLTALSNPKLRARRAAEMDWHFLHAVAANVAFLFDYLHDRDIVIGDVRPENILVGDRALATMIDCDSVQISGRDGVPFLCPVGSEGYTPPEWIGRRFSDRPRDRRSDRFGLAVLIHQLLTGAHPWTGEWMGAGDPPPRDHLIRSGDWPFRPGSKLRPVPGMVAPDELAPGLASLFRRAFIAGHADPDARPSASEWQEALCHALADLETCEKKPHHHRDAALSSCPWCARVDAGLPDPFPASPTPRDPFAPLILAFERALARGDTRMAVDLWVENSILSRVADLTHLHDRMKELRGAIDALDQWQAALSRTPDDIRGLAALADDLPQLLNGKLFLHESVEGEAVPDFVRRIAEAALAIPPAPACPVPELPTPPIAAPTETASVPKPSAAATASPIAIAYRVEGGWHGLRAARLQVTVEKPGRVPALTLVDDLTGTILLSLPAQRLRGTTTFPFDQPDHRVVVSLRASDGSGVRIKPAPKRTRTIGSAAGGFLTPAPQVG